MNRFVLLLMTLFVVFPPVALAQTTPTPTCVPVFGGGDTCVRNAPVVVNKLVRDPDSGVYVDTLTNPYTPGQSITFHIFVTNTTDKDVTGISVKDIFPSYLQYKDGDGSFDFNKQTFTARLTSLRKGESKAIIVSGTVVAAEKLPSSPSPLCISNIATATQDGKTSSDTTSFCLSKPIQENKSVSTTTGTTNSGSTKSGSTQSTSTTKGGLPIYSRTSIKSKSTPATGPEDLVYLGIIIPAAGGWFLRKKALSIH